MPAACVGPGLLLLCHKTCLCQPRTCWVGTKICADPAKPQMAAVKLPLLCPNSTSMGALENRVKGQGGRGRAALWVGRLHPGKEEQSGSVSYARSLLFHSITTFLCPQSLQGLMWGSYFLGKFGCRAFWGNW